MRRLKDRASAKGKDVPATPQVGLEQVCSTSAIGLSRDRPLGSDPSYQTGMWLPWARWGLKGAAPQALGTPTQARTPRPCPCSKPGSPPSAEPTLPIPAHLFLFTFQPKDQSQPPPPQSEKVSLGGQGWREGDTLH